jgi:hypothetical protein
MPTIKAGTLGEWQSPAAQFQGLRAAADGDLEGPHDSPDGRQRQVGPSPGKEIPRGQAVPAGGRAGD